MPKQTKAAKNKTQSKAVSTAAVKEKKKTGTESQYDKKVKPFLADIARYSRCGVTEGQLCEYYGVGKTAWAEYKKNNPELTEILCKAHRELKTDLVNQSYKVAMGYEYTETTTVEYKDDKGNVTGSKTTTHKKYAKADGGMLQFLLINRYPTEYARDPQVIELRKRALELAEQGKLPPDAEGL